MSKDTVKLILVLAGIVVIALHYFHFVDQIRNDQECFNNLLRAQYSNQNQLNEEFFDIFYDERYTGDTKGQLAAFDKAFTDQKVRFVENEKRYPCGQK